MVQRYERRTIDQQIVTARQELSLDYEQLDQRPFQQLTNSDSAQLLISMINKLSSPLVGMQVLRTDLFQMEFPNFAQYEMVMDKAEIFYYQSIMQDLIRIKNEEPIMQINKQDIKQCIQQINWKINIERSSVVQSGQIGQNMDLMKFFEGVRNYQNWHENIKKDSLQKLKEKAHIVQNELSFKKGFIVTKLSDKILSIQNDHRAEIFKINRNFKRFLRITNIIGKVRHKALKQYFNDIIQSNKQPQANVIVSRMFNRYYSHKFIMEIRKTAIEYKTKKENIDKLVRKSLEIKRKMETVHKFTSFKRLNIKPMIKASRFTQAIRLISHSTKKIIIRLMLKNLNIPAKILLNKLSQLFRNQVESSWNQLKEQDIEKRLERPNVSARVKGKILISLNKYEKEPINLKKTFSRWYLNTHDQKYSKKIYNIWLKGPTSKFTVFMRLKNLVDLVNKQMISKEMIKFIRVMCKNYQKYQQYNKKNMLAKWIKTTRKHRKIEIMKKQLTKVDNKKNQYKRYSLDQIANLLRRKHVVKQYCNRYLHQKMENFKIAMRNWRNISNIKEYRRKKLTAILLNVFDQTINTQKQVLAVLKKNRQKCIEMKREQFIKANNRYAVCMERLFQLWRHNIANNKKQISTINQTIKINKTNSLISIQSIGNHVQTLNLRQIISKFRANKSIKNKKYNNLKKNFMKIILNNEETLKKEILNKFISYLRIGQHKKQKLIIKLVHANIIKEKIGLMIMKNKSFEITELDKRQKSRIIFELLESKMKQNYIIFNKKLHVFKVLQKIVNNYTENARLSLSQWKAMPLRMRWNLRNKALSFHNKLFQLMNSRLKHCQHQLRSSLLAAKLKQKRVVYLMANKFEMVVRKYFLRYYKNISLKKQDDQIYSVTHFFEELKTKTIDNFKPIYLSPPEWPKKALHFSKLNDRVKKRLQDYFTIWHKSANALKYFQHIKNQKKRRQLEILEKLMHTIQWRKTKVAVQAFNRNSRIQKLQINFLKRLCDTQAGKLVKGFNLWKHLPLAKNKQRITKAAKFQSNLHRLVIRNIKKTMNIMKQCHYFGNQQKKYCIRKLVAISCSGISQYFDRWRENKNLISLFAKNRRVANLFETIHQKNEKSFQLLITGDQSKKKLKSLNIVENWWNKQKKYFIKKWFKNSYNLKMKDISKKHLLRNVNIIKNQLTNKTISQNIIKKFVNNRLQVLREKKKIKSENLIKIIENYEAQKRVELMVTMDKFKFLQIKGNFKKNNAFHKFLSQKIGEVHQVLVIWNNLAQQVKEAHKQKMASNNFDSLFQALRGSFKIMFSRSRETIIKKNSLDKIFNVQQIKFKGFFNLWRQNTKELKILGEMNKKTKAAILEKINKIVQSTSTQAVISTIKKFHQNSKIQKVQKKFIEKLLQTKGGKAIQAFKSWKSIPYSTSKGKYKNYQKFYFKLENFYKDRLKFAHSTFSQSAEDGTTMKKQSIMKLFETTSLGIRRYYNRWTRLTKEKHILSTVNASMIAFQSAETAIANNYLIVFQDQRSYRLKISAIERLIAAATGTTQNYFIKWRQNVRQINMANNMNKESKKMALKMFTKVLGNTKINQVLNIISMFKKNATMIKIQKTFFNKLMNTKTGKVINFFQKLKTIPDAKMNKAKKKAIIFQSRLNMFSMRRLRDTLHPFKENTYTAVIKKKYCLDKLARACMGENKKKFIIWRNVVRQGKMLNHTGLFDKIFSNLQNISKSNFQIVTKDCSSQVQKKKNLCRKLINNSLFVQHHAYMIWKEAYHIDDINNSKKQNTIVTHLRNLSSVFNNNQNKKIVQTLSIFRRLLQIRNFQEHEFYKNYKNKKCLAFYDNLNKIYQSNKSSFVMALKTNQTEYSLAQKSQKLMSIFIAMQNVTKINFSHLISTEKQTVLLQKMFTKLFTNTTNNIARVFNIWKQKKIAINHKNNRKNDKKQQALSQLSYLLKQKDKSDIIVAIHKFESNMKVCKIKKALCLKILKCRSDTVPLMFNNWKKLPYQQAKKLKNKATKFEKGILMFMINRLKLVNDCFKKCNLDGIIKKENAARNIVKSKLLEVNNLFFRWRKITNEIKITQKIITLDRSFGIADQVFHSNFSIFDGCKIQDQRKIQASTTLFNNNVKRFKDYFTVWRKSARALKLYQLDRLLRNFNAQDFNKRLMKIGFMMIQKRKDMQTLKGYINSLWKWKMSNIQATYYSKFIKIFKQSQELIKLSNLLNKKLYQNIHHSFRRILSVGDQKTNRKKQIVEKYLTRKARNYFNDFKNNILHTQINIWKSKYTESIKAKIWMDVLSAIILKSQYAAFNTIKNYQLYTVKIDTLQLISRNYQANNLRKAYNKIKAEGPKNLLSIVSQLTSTISDRNITQSFKCIAEYSKLSKFNDIISKTMYKNNLNSGFTKIYKKKQKIIKSRLSIILLETLIGQLMTDRIKQSIKKFNNSVKKIGSAEKIFKFMNNRYDSYGKELIEGGKNLLKLARLLQKFKRGQALQRILQKQDEQLKKTYLNKMRKKENKWMELAIKKFATRASIRSSPAIAIWRLKTYKINQ